MAFVPEGQRDRSQAGSAWIAMQKVRPGGTAEVIVSPIDICRRSRVHAALQKPVFLWKNMLAPRLSRDPFNRPAGTGIFSL
jgi:hypothetical protein